MTHAQLEPILIDGFRVWMIKKCIQVCDFSYEQAEDIVQNIYLALLRTKRFDPSKGSIATYARWWLVGKSQNGTPIASVKSGTNPGPSPPEI